LYQRPKHEYTEVHPDLIAFLKSRNLPEDIAEMREVGYYLHPTSKEGYIAFNYHENGVHINTKYRSLKQKAFQLERGAKLSLYLIDHLKLADKYAIITEGELDALSWRAAGYQLVVSVPNGASSNTSYLDDSMDIFNRIESVYIAADSDNKGTELALTLADRIGREKCKLIKFPDGIKDSNEVLQRFGLEYGVPVLKDCFASAVPFPIDGIETVQDNMDEAYRYLIHGYPETLYTGVPGLDDLFTIYPSEVTIVVAPPGAGKSNLVDAITVNMSRTGMRSGVLSAEKSSALHITGLVRKYLNKAEVSTEEVMPALAHLNDHFFYISSDGLLTIEDILHRAEQLVKSRGIKILVIDNLSYVKQPNANNISDAAAALMAKVKAFTKKYRLATFLVAHPRKLEADMSGQFPVPSGYDILGSGHYYNLTDNIIAMARRDSTAVEVVTRKIKNMEFVAPIHDLGARTIQFDWKSGGNYTEVSKAELARMKNTKELEEFQFDSFREVAQLVKDMKIEPNRQEVLNFD
jgi:twinkle protein